MSAAPYRVVAGSAAAAIAKQRPKPAAAAVIELITGALAEIPREVGKQLWKENRGHVGSASRIVPRPAPPRRPVVRSSGPLGDAPASGTTHSLLGSSKPLYLMRNDLAALRVSLSFAHLGTPYLG